LSIRVEFIQL